MPDDLSFRAPNNGYLWSKDYASLVKAMGGGAIVATVLYDNMRDGTKIFDVCFMMCRPVSYKHVELIASARGIEYFSARDESEFIALCEKYEVSFLDPKVDSSFRSALAPILRHAEGPDTAPPLRLSVAETRRIKKEVGDAAHK